MLIKYWASATASGFPLMVIVRSVLPPSRSSQFEIRIMAPEIWRISAILVPPLPMMQPIKSFGTVISCCCVLVCVRLWVVRNCEPARAARAAGHFRLTFFRTFFKSLRFTYNLRYLTGWFRLDLTEWHRPNPKLLVLPKDSSLVRSSASDFFFEGEKEKKICDEE